MTKFNDMLARALLLTGFVLLICTDMSVNAQKQYIISACKHSKTQNFVGNRLRLPLPNGAIVKKGGDIDYENYFIGYGDKKHRVWLSGIFGPNATSGEVPKEWINSSTDLVQRTWKSGGDKGIDAEGKLTNGNYWRFLGRNGEAIIYYDVPGEAADYFNNIIKNVCYQAWKQ